MFWARIDNRLIHGQVVEAWLPYTGASTIIVVNDDLADDALQQEIMSLAIPRSVSAVFLRVEQCAERLGSMGDLRDAVLVLFASCGDVRRAVEKGLRLEVLNIGNLHYGPGKKQLSPSVAVNAEDESCLRFLLANAVELDFRCVPNDPVQVRFA